MKNLIAFFQRAGNFSALPFWACLAFGFLTACIAIQLLQSYADSRMRTELNIKLEKLQEHLFNSTTHNRAMGVALLLGLNESIIKHAALGEIGFDSPEVLQRLRIVRKHFDFEGMYIINKQGEIIANDTDGIKSTRGNIAFRPYFQQAIKGQEAVYMAIGTHSNSRGLFVAAPIHTTTEKGSEIIGVMAIKLSLEESLDNLWNKKGEEVLLISPQGVVFASSRKEWQLTSAAALDEKRIQEIRKVQQFGRRFENSSPPALGFDPLQPLINFQNKRFIAQHIAINWTDPNGQWLAVLMEDSEKWPSALQKLDIFVLILIVTSLIGLLLQRQTNRTKRLSLSLAKENEERNKAQENNLAAAEERALIARVTAELRQVKDYTELVRTFMYHASQLFSVGYGLFYVADNNRKKLRLIGGYGVAISDMDSEIPYGEGLAGQCALEGKGLQINQPPPNYIKIASACGAMTAKVILLSPLLLKGKLVGVLELAAFSILSDKQEKMLAELEIIVAENIEIMEQRQALELEFRRQRASEAKLEAIINHVSDGIVGLDTGGNIIFINPSAAAMLGYEQEELIGASFHTVLHSDTLCPDHDCPIKAACLDGKPRHSTDDELIRKDQTILHAEYKTTAMIDKDNEITGIVIAFHDVSENRAAEARLRQQASLQQAIIDTIPYPIFYKGRDSRFLGFNREYEKTFNVRRNDLIGKRVLDLDYLPIEDRIAYQAEDERVIADVGEIQREMLIPFADGDLHKTLYCVSGFRLDDQPGGLVGIFIDFAKHTKRD